MEREEQWLALIIASCGLIVLFFLKLFSLIVFLSISAPLFCFFLFFSSSNVFPGVNEKMWSFGVDVKASSGLCASSKDPLTDIGLGVTAGVLVVLLLSGSCYCFVVKPRSSTTNNPRRYADFGDSGVTLDESENGPIQEGSMVTDANGKKLQVRLVPSYVSPNDGSGGGGGGSGAEQIDLGGVQEETKSNGQPSTSFV